MRSIFIFMLIAVCCMARGQTVTSVTPNQAYQGQSLYTTISSSSLFMTGSSPQGNIQDILLKNANDSVFAISDSINVVDANTSTAFWNIPGNIATGLYSLIVRVYDNLFTGSTTDYSLSNAFTVTAPSATISGTVYDDRNRNGVQDNGEPGLPGYTIRLSPLGNITVSDASGHYTISTIAGLDTVTIQVPIDGAYLPSGPSSYTITAVGGNNSGQDFGLYKDRYLISMSPDSTSINQLLSASILAQKVFKNGVVTNVVLRHSIYASLIYASSYSSADSDHAIASFDLHGARTGIYDLIVVVRSNTTNQNNTYVLDSAITLYGAVGYISGYAFIDINGNGIKDAGEPPLRNDIVTISGNGNTGSQVTDSTGFYEFYSLGNGSYQIDIYNPGNSYISCVPPDVYTTSQNYTVVINRDTTNNLNFGITANQSTVYDLYVSPYWTGAVPGFVRTGCIYYGNSNSHASPTNTVITLKYDGNLTFRSASTTPTNQDAVNHILTWNVGTVTSNGMLQIFFDVPASLSLGTLLVDSVSIDPTVNDCRTYNNSSYWMDFVRSSMDPNEKVAYPSGELYTGQDSIVTYTIRCQNTGNAPTHFVIIKDTLDANLDFKTVMPIAASTSYKFDNDKGMLTFTMDPLILADSATDEPHSHGFVSFRVKVKSGTPVGTVIHNKASIYFDYNAAVNTNTTVNTVSNPLGIQNRSDAMNVSVRPNPLEESATLSYSNPSHDRYVLKLYDITGNLVNTMTSAGSEFRIERGGMAAGVYMYKLTNQNTKQSAQGKISVL